MAVYRGLVGFRGDARLLTWAYRIAVREALRQKGARAGETGLDDEPPAPESGDPALRRERVEQLRRAFDRLSADHRAVLSLFAIDGLSHREIADILKVPEGTIWSRLHKARKRLADEMAQLEAGPAPANGSASASSAIRARRAGRRQSRHASPALRIAARTWRHLGDLRRPSLRRGLGASRRAAASLAPAKFENSAAPG